MMLLKYLIMMRGKFPDPGWALENIVRQTFVGSRTYDPKVESKFIHLLNRDRSGAGGVGKERFEG
jgi:hypothetical protein